MRALSRFAVAVVVSCQAAGLVLGTADRGAGAPAKPAPRDENAFASATLVSMGQKYLKDKSHAEARKYCEQALARDPNSSAATRCIDDVVVAEREIAAAARERTDTADAAKVQGLIIEAESRAAAGQYDKAFEVLTKAREAAKTEEQVRRVNDATREVRPDLPSAIKQRATDSWVFDLLFIIALLLAFYFAMKVLRGARRRYRAFRHGGHFARRWLLLPIPPVKGHEDLDVGSMVLDAIKQLPRTLHGDLEVPTLLPLRPLKPESYEPEVWKDFRIRKARVIRDLETPLALELNQNKIELADATQDLQFKLGGFEIGNVSKFLKNVGRWFNEGVPCIAGSVSLSEKGDKWDATVRLTRSADGEDFGAVFAQTEHDSRTEAVRLATERAVYKLIYQFANPRCSHPEANGLAARRQGLDLLQRYVAAGSGAGDARKHGLQKAADNLAFARSSFTENTASCELHLFEGIARALLDEREKALELFRTVQDIAQRSDRDQVALRLQAIYNQAVLEQRQAKPDCIARAIQLYERVIAEVPADSKDRSNSVEVLQFLARFGLQTAMSQYPASEWLHLDRDRVGTWVERAGTFVGSLGGNGGATGPVDFREERIGEFIALESRRAFATVALRYLTTDPRSLFAGLYPEVA